VFENKLKPETIPHIELLQKNGIQIHMVTGDNPLTSLSVAKQCQLLSSSADISILDIIEERNEIKSTLNGIQTPLEGIIPLL
jgi:cation-transporting ATPase 13A2